MVDTLWVSHSAVLFISIEFSDWSNINISQTVGIYQIKWNRLVIVTSWTKARRAWKRGIYSFALLEEQLCRVNWFPWELLHHGRRAGIEKNDPNRSGQRWNNFHTSYIDRSFVVSGNNRVVKPKCKQFTSLNKMLSNSKVLIVHISFTALINNEGIGGIRKVPRRIKWTFCSCRK